MVRVSGGSLKNTDFDREPRRIAPEFVPQPLAGSEARPVTQKPAGPAGFSLGIAQRQAYTPTPGSLTQQQAEARSTIDNALQDDVWYEWVTADDMRSAAQTLQSLSPRDTSAVLQSMASDGQLTKLVDRSLRRFPVGEHSAMIANLAGKANETDLLALDRAFQSAGADARAEYIDLVSAYAKPDAQAGFCASLLSETAFEGAGLSLNAPADNPAIFACRMLKNVQAEDLGNAWAALEPAQQRAALNASIKARGGAAGPDLRLFRDLMSNAASICDAGQRASMAAGVLDLIERLPASARGAAAASMAQTVLGSFGVDAIERISGRQRAVLANALANGAEGLGTALHMLSVMPGSTSRDELVWSIFLETPDMAYQRSPTLAGVMARGLALEVGEDASPSAEQVNALAAFLNSQDGRMLLANAGADSAARFLILTDILQRTGSSQGICGGDSAALAKLAETGELATSAALEDLTARTALIEKLDQQIVVASPEDRVRLMLLRDEVDFDRRFYLAEIIRRQSDLILGQTPGLTRDEMTRPVDLQQSFEAEARSRAEIARARFRHSPPASRG
jgi:hypothetical protein